MPPVLRTLPLPPLIVTREVSPAVCRITSSAAARIAAPPALIVPALLTLRPTNTVSPPDRMAPRLTTSPAPEPLRLTEPFAMKAFASAGRVLATKPPPVMTLPPGATITPCGLTRYTLPVAPIEPAIVDDAFPVTMFNVAPAPLLNWTLLPAPTEKLFQFITPRAPVWAMVSCDWPVVICPLPAVKRPPAGKVGWLGLPA